MRGVDDAAAFELGDHRLLVGRRQREAAPRTALPGATLGNVVGSVDHDGAYPKNTTEYASCTTQDAAHVQRFDDEKSLRFLIDRPAAGTPTPIGFGPATHEDVDVPALLTRLAH